ncbi:MAG: hypothetical protein MI702_06305, partial [Chlorobiales bacterium]|nr:hypothetical protein [Chlorobiales bacterium]
MSRCGGCSPGNDVGKAEAAGPKQSGTPGPDRFSGGIKERGILHQPGPEPVQEPTLEEPALLGQEGHGPEGKDPAQLDPGLRFKGPMADHLGQELGQKEDPGLFRPDLPAPGSVVPAHGQGPPLVQPPMIQKGLAELGVIETQGGLLGLRPGMSVLGQLLQDPAEGGGAVGGQEELADVMDQPQGQVAPPQAQLLQGQALRQKAHGQGVGPQSIPLSKTFRADGAFQKAEGQGQVLEPFR